MDALQGCSPSYGQAAAPPLIPWELGFTNPVSLLLDKWPAHEDGPAEAWEEEKYKRTATKRTERRASAALVQTSHLPAQSLFLHQEMRITLHRAGIM